MSKKRIPDTLRVMMLSQRFPPLGNTGAPLQAWHLSNALRRRGTAVEVTTTRPFFRAARSRSEQGEGTPVTAMAYLDVPGAASISRFIQGSRTSFPAARWDVVHGHALSPMILGAALTKRAYSAPLLVKPSIGGDHPEGEIRRIRDSLGHPLLHRALQKIDLFAVLDDLIEEDLESAGIPPERRCRVDNGIDLQAYYPSTQAAKLALRRQFGLPCGAQVVLFCGQLIERKGIDALLGAWSPQLACEHNAVLAICGDGALRHTVNEAALHSAGSLVYLGSVADSSAVMRMADVLILPSRCESFGNVIMEALASGLPVAATACGIAPRVLAAGRCGWLIAETSREAIGEALRTLFAESALWQQKSTEGRAVAEQFSIDRTAEFYLEIYRQLLADSRAGL